MENIIKQLHQGHFSCVIANRDTVRTFTQRGVVDLYDLLKADPDFLKGASVADKVVGKGAAAILIQGGVREVYTDLISTSAHALLVDAGIRVDYQKLVHHIANRDQTDWCPLEKRCKETNSIKELLPIIDHFIATIREKTAVGSLLTNNR